MIYRLLVMLLLFACGEKDLSITRSLKVPLPIDYSAYHIFVAAHPDDWQLFMGDFAYPVISSATTSVVIITLTAGDDGKDDAYWQARELGHFASVRTVLKTPLRSGGDNESTETITTPGGTIDRNVLRNVVSYSLRLPDGDLHGGGSQSYGGQSLLKLYRGEIATITDVSSQLAYNLVSLHATLRHLLRSELVDEERPVFVYTLDPGPKKQYSHSDHFITYQLTRDVLQDMNLPTCRLRLFADYRTEHKRRNLDSVAQQQKFQLFEAYDLMMQEQLGHCNMCIPSHHSWLSRSYSREYNCH